MGRGPESVLVGGMPEDPVRDPDPRDVIGCACPRTDARDCIRARHSRFRHDWKVMGTEPGPEDDDDDECECSCHDFCNCCRESLADCYCEGGPF